MPGPIGIIHPPPDIRMIIEKLATFVAMNGPELERRIVANETGNAKFDFLLPSSPYHAYYQRRVSELRSQSSKPLEDSSAGPKPDPKILEQLMLIASIAKNLKRPEERVAAERIRDPTKFVVSPITGELVPISEMRMMAKIRLTTLAAGDEISKDIVRLARTRPDIFQTTEEEEEVLNAVKAEIEKKDEQPKQFIWDGQAMSQSLNGEEQGDANATDDGRMLPGPAAPPPRPGVPSICPLPLPPGMPLNMHPWYAPMQYSAQMPRPGMMQKMPPPMRPPGPPVMSIAPGQQKIMMGRPPTSVNPPNMPLPPPPGSQFTPLGIGPPYPPMPMPPPPNMPMVPPPPSPHGMPPPPPPDEAPPPLPDEPEPKRQRVGDSSLIPEDKFLAQHPGSVRISVSVPNVDEGNLKGQTLEIIVESLAETIGSLKETIAGEVQLPANKQKLSGSDGFLKDNLTLAYYNIAPGETLTLALRERA